MQVVILASGLGTRLRPLTLTVPKSMVPINGRTFLAYQAVAERIPAGTTSSLEEDLVATLAPSGELGSYPVGQRFYDTQEQR